MGPLNQENILNLAAKLGPSVYTFLGLCALMMMFDIP